MSHTDLHEHQSHSEPERAQIPEHQGEPSKESTSIDPVCGMTVSLGPDTQTETVDGKTLSFCSEECREKYKADPWFYESGRAAERTKTAPVNLQYTCPMHPEIVRDAPGACPLCGMALETTVPTDEPSQELTDFTRRMWLSATAAVPLMVLTMGPMVGLPVRDWIGHQTAGYLELALATPSAPLQHRSYFSLSFPPK